MKIIGIDEIVKNAFGLWITALFDGILVPNPGLTFEEHKEAFFWVLQKLLDEGKVKFCPPNELWHEGYDVWDADNKAIVEYLRSHWPKSAKAEIDRVLVDYFYDMPAILWVGEDGQLHSS